MKKNIVLISLLAIVLAVTSCAKQQDNTCVKKIVEILQTSYTTESTGSEPNMVVSMLETNGDIFMAPDIWTIINDNQDYKLTLEDKAMLEQSVSLFGLPKAQDTENWSPELADIQAAEQRMIKANVNECISKIKKADKLKDLLN